MKEKAMMVMPTFNAYVLLVFLHSTSKELRSSHFLGYLSFELEQGFRNSFRFVNGTLQVSRRRNKFSHFREPFGFSSTQN